MTGLIIPERMEYLGSIKLGSAAASSSVLSIAAREMLLIQFNIPGYGGSDIASLRFNGDTGANYNSSYITWTTAAPGAPTNTLSTTMFRLGANAVGNQRSGQVTVYNVLGTQHIVTCMSATQSASGTAPATSVGSGNWNSASSAQITSIQMLTPGGATMSAGSEFVVFGINP